MHSTTKQERRYGISRRGARSRQTRSPSAWTDTSGLPSAPIACCMFSDSEQSNERASLPLGSRTAAKQSESKSKLMPNLFESRGLRRLWASHGQPFHNPVREGLPTIQPEPRLCFPTIVNESSRKSRNLAQGDECYCPALVIGMRSVLRACCAGSFFGIEGTQ
jgi:hypothetical protein